MSRHDFSEQEFADRIRRTRQAIGTAELDWLLVIHPMSMHWLIGAETKSYQAFQCLLVSAQYKKAKLRAGGLKDIAPTIFAIMGIKQPKEMTGKNLII